MQKHSNLKKGSIALSEIRWLKIDGEPPQNRCPLCQQVQRHEQASTVTVHENAFASPCLPKTVISHGRSSDPANEKKSREIVFTQAYPLSLPMLHAPPHLQLPLLANEHFRSHLCIYQSMPKQDRLMVASVHVQIQGEAGGRTTCCQYRRRKMRPGELWLQRGQGPASFVPCSHI